MQLVAHKKHQNRSFRITTVLSLLIVGCENPSPGALDGGSVDANILGHWDCEFISFDGDATANERYTFLANGTFYESVEAEWGDRNTVSVTLRGNWAVARNSLELTTVNLLILGGKRNGKEVDPAEFKNYEDAERAAGTRSHEISEYSAQRVKFTDDRGETTCSR